MRRPRVLLLLLLCFSSASCFKKWEPSTVTPQEAIEASPDQVRLRLSDGSELEVRNPSLEGESIVLTELDVSATRTCLTRPDGTVGTACTVQADTTAERQAIPLADVEGVDLRKGNWTANIFFGVIGTVGGFMLLLAGMM